jgi:uncharacterized membrane protein (UPF0127 family)
LTSFLAPLLRGESERFDLINTRTSQPIARRIEMAFDSASRRRGLLGRDRMDDDSALIIAPCGAVHTFSMRFAIDVIFAARNGTVLKTYAAVPRSRIAFALRAHAAVELPAGTIDRSHARTGDVLAVIER